MATSKIHGFAKEFWRIQSGLHFGRIEKVTASVSMGKMEDAARSAAIGSMEVYNYAVANQVEIQKQLEKENPGVPFVIGKEVKKSGE